MHIMLPHIIMTGIPISIMPFMRSQHSIIISLVMPPIGVILQTMVPPDISQVMPIIIIGIIWGIIWGIICDIICGIIIEGIMPPIMGIIEAIIWGIMFIIGIIWGMFIPLIPIIEGPIIIGITLLFIAFSITGGGTVWRGRP